MAEDGAGEENLLAKVSMSRANSVKSRCGALSKTQEVSHLQSKYENEIEELRQQTASLEMKNKKYLEIIGMTASEQQENMRLQIEAAQEALTFTKRAKTQQGLGQNEMQILEELEEMLEAQQKEMAVYQDQISVLTRDLETQQKSLEEKVEGQHKAFE